MTTEDFDQINADYFRPRLVLDANVLASAVKRDIILRFAVSGMFQVYWSPIILKETLKALQLIRKKTGENEEVVRIKSKQAIEKITQRFPDSIVNTGDVMILPDVELPDPNDKHVVETAIFVKARYIITDNLKDFPQKSLDNLHLIPSLEAINADELIFKTLEEKTHECLLIIKRLRENLRKPPMEAETLLNNWKNRQNLNRTVKFLQRYKDKI